MLLVLPASIATSDRKPSNTTSPEAVRDSVRSLLASVDLPGSLVDDLELVNGHNIVTPSSFAVGHAAQASIAASALSASHLYQIRGGQRQTVQVDEQQAVLDFSSENWTLANGAQIGELWDPLAGLYPAANGGQVRIHTNFPHHRKGIVELLRCEDTRESVSHSLLKWEAIKFETVANQKGLCVSALRSFDEWDRHPQAQALRGVPPVQVLKLGSPIIIPLSWSTELAPSYPLSGVRVLDLTRIIAGPVAARTLAAHGADILHITSPHLPHLPLLDIDTCRGKRTTQLDVDDPADRYTLEQLVAECDVFLQSYRPGSLEAKGFGVADVLRMRNGKSVVYASLRAYGWDGPWSMRRGFDSLTQTAIGFNIAEGEAYQQFTGDATSGRAAKALPLQCLDHAAGQLLALGICAALAQGHTSGQSSEVRVSLANTGHWVRSLPRVPPEHAFGLAESLPERLREQADILRVDVPLSTSDVRGKAGFTESLETLRSIPHAAKMSFTGTTKRPAPRSLNGEQPIWKQQR